MKKIFNLLPLLALVMLVFTGCQEEDRAFPEFGDEDVQTGAYARVTDGINGEFDFLDVDNSGVDFTVEFFDVNNGNDVASYTWTVTYVDRGPVTIADVDASSFTKNDDGLPATTIRFGFAETLSALGMTVDDIVPGQNFVFDATITMNDGRTFTAANTAPNIQGQPLYQGLFNFRQGIINLPCISDLVGEYDVTATVTNQMAGIGWDDCDGNTYTTKVRFVAQHDNANFGKGTYILQTLDANDVWQDDASMAGFYACYTGSQTDPSALPTNIDDQGMLRLTEDCGALAWEGASQWGEVYTIVSVEVDGVDLTIAWTNDYGEGASCKLTRTDGSEWPEDLIDGDG